MKDQEKVDTLLREIGQEYPECGFYIGDGWFPIVANALRKMAALNVGWKLTQVKEKFCGLRIYFSAEDKYDEMNAIVREAENLCDNMCELCGAPHGLEIPMSGMALCKNCKNKRNKGE